MAKYFTLVLIVCFESGEKSPWIVRTDLPLTDLVKRGEPYAYDTINPKTGDVEHYDPANDAHPGGPVCTNYEDIVGEISYQERLDLFKKIRERDQKHTDEATYFLLQA